MRILVVSAGRTGSTASIAERVGSGLRAVGAEVVVMTLRESPSALRYDAVVAGACMRTGQWNPDMKRWVENSAQRLRRIPVAAFAVGLAGMVPWPESISQNSMHQAFDTNGVTPLATATFLGWWKPDLVGDADHELMDSAGAHPPVGDHRDPRAVDHWTRELVPLLATAYH